MWHLLRRIAEEEAVGTIAPERIMFDFEKAAHNATHKMFPNADVLCCRFHFGQSLFRHIQADSTLLTAFNERQSEEGKI
jgi:hypothetical protein